MNNILIEMGEPLLDVGLIMMIERHIRLVVDISILFKELNIETNGNERQLQESFWRPNYHRKRREHTVV